MFLPNAIEQLHNEHDLTNYLDLDAAHRLKTIAEHLLIFLDGQGWLDETTCKAVFDFVSKVNETHAPPMTLEEELERR